MKSQFINEIFFALEDIEELEALFSTNTVTPEVVSHLLCYSHLEYDDNGLLSKANRYFEGELDEPFADFEKSKGNFKYKNWPERKFYALKYQQGGLHQLGGEAPVNFTMPELGWIAPPLYLGFINNKAEEFMWLPFPLHLVCPIHHNFWEFYLDYSDPLAPISINNEDIDAEDCDYDVLSEDSIIIYQKRPFNFVTANEASTLGMAGVPFWLQNAQIPRCPKTGNLMKFVCQLGGGVPVDRYNIEPENDFMAHYYNEMNWGDGSLYVFFEPTSKVACYFIQGT